MDKELQIGENYLNTYLENKFKMHENGSIVVINHNFPYYHNELNTIKSINKLKNILNPCTFNNSAYKNGVNLSFWRSGCYHYKLTLFDRIKRMFK